MNHFPSKQITALATGRNRQRMLAALAVALGLLVAGCGSANHVRGSRHAEMTAPIFADMGVAVVQGGLEPALAAELARELSSKLGERGLRSTFRVVPPNEEAGAAAFAQLFEAHRAVLVVGPRGPRQNTQGQGSVTFSIEVLQLFDASTPESPKAVAMRTSWKGEGETPPAESEQEVLPLFASTIVAKLVSDRVVR